MPVVQKTWAQDVGVASLVYYSDKEDKKYSAVYSGVPNTEMGKVWVEWWVLHN